MKSLRTLWSRIPGRGGRGPAPPPMPPQEEEIAQSTQAWFGNVGLAYMFRDGDSAVLSMGGTSMKNEVIQAEAGQTVQVGPYKIVIAALDLRDGCEYVRVIVSVSGDGTGE